MLHPNCHYKMTGKVSICVTFTVESSNYVMIYHIVFHNNLILNGIQYLPVIIPQRFSLPFVSFFLHYNLFSFSNAFPLPVLVPFIFILTYPHRGNEHANASNEVTEMLLTSCPSAPEFPSVLNVVAAAFSNILRCLIPFNQGFWTTQWTSVEVEVQMIFWWKYWEVECLKRQSRPSDSDWGPVVQNVVKITTLYASAGAEESCV